MADFLQSFGLSPVSWALALLAAALVGGNKAGLVSISLLSIPIFAAVFGGKVSTGFLLPIIIMADLIAIFSYRKNIRWKKLLTLFPWAFAGMIVAVLVGNRVADNVFKIFIAASVFVVLVFLMIKEFTGSDIKVKSTWYMNAVIGLLGGFSSMIGNAGGPIVAAYFQSQRLDKNTFVSTRAWFFFLVNMTKLPLHIFFWKTVDLHSFGFDLLMIPAIAAGGAAGFFLVRRIPERPYRLFVIFATLVSSVFLII